MDQPKQSRCEQEPGGDTAYRDHEGQRQRAFDAAPYACLIPFSEQPGKVGACTDAEPGKKPDDDGHEDRRVADRG